MAVVELVAVLVLLRREPAAGQGDLREIVGCWMVYRLDTKTMV